MMKLKKSVHRRTVWQHKPTKATQKRDSKRQSKHAESNNHTCLVSYEKLSPPPTFILKAGLSTLSPPILYT